MKPTITAAALVGIALAAPSEAGAFAGAASDPTATARIEMNGGAVRYQGFGDWAAAYGRSFHDHRSHGFGYYGYRQILPARVIVRSLRARRFCRISHPRLRRGLYHAWARDAYGRRVRLVIDPYSGVILRLRYR